MEIFVESPAGQLFQYATGRYHGPHVHLRSEPRPAGDWNGGGGERTPLLSATDVQIKPEGEYVDWYGPDDPENPKNWSTAKKCYASFCICLLTFVVYLGPAIIAPGAKQIHNEFNKSNVMEALVLTSFIVGYGLGPQLWSPISEIPAIGRNPPYIISTALFVLAQIPIIKATSFEALCGFRFLAGFLGSAAFGIGEASIVDMFHPPDVPVGVAFYTFAAIIGPACAPVISGFVIPTKGWRYAHIELMWISLGVLVLLFFTLPETSGDNILTKRAHRIRRLTGDQDIQSQSHSERPDRGFFTAAKDDLIKPVKILFTDAVLLVICVYYGFVYALFYAWFESFETVFEGTYGYSLSKSQLPFLSIVAGAALAFIGYLLWHRYVWHPKHDKQDGSLAPEFALQPAFVGAIILPIGLFLFSHSEKHPHWTVPCFAIALYGVGDFSLFTSLSQYIEEAYPGNQASALAAFELVQAAMAALFPVLAQILFKALGVARGVQILASVTVVFLPAPFVIYKYGKKLRDKSDYAQSPDDD